MLLFFESSLYLYLLACLLAFSRRPEQLDLRRVAHVSCIGESEVRLQRMGLIKNLQRV